MGLHDKNGYCDIWGIESWQSKKGRLWPPLVESSCSRSSSPLHARPPSPHLPFPTKLYSQYWHYPSPSLPPVARSVEAFIPGKWKRIVGQNSVVLPFPPFARRPSVRSSPLFLPASFLPLFLCSAHAHALTEKGQV